MTTQEAKDKAVALFGEDDGHAWDAEDSEYSYSSYGLHERFGVVRDMSAKRPTAFRGASFEEAFEKALTERTA